VALEQALAAAAPAVELRLAGARLGAERDARQASALLGEILQGKVNEATRRRALDLGWELEGWHTGIHIRVGTEVDLVATRGEVIRTLAAEGVAAVVVQHSDGYAGWATQATRPAAAEVHELAATLRRVQHRLAAALHSAMGVGRPHPGADGIAATLSEAGDAARLARNRVESGRFVHVDRLGLAHLLLAWTRTDTFEPAARALLEPLRAAPGDLVRTLGTYLDCESSLAETAAVLGIHRNTVAARLQRIQSILGVDLSRPDERLALHLACRTASEAD
jgi:DNA-binding PucR family transcriptional regulator